MIYKIFYDFMRVGNLRKFSITVNHGINYRKMYIFVF